MKGIPALALMLALSAEMLTPAFAHAEMTACQLLERADIEQITSLKFEMAQSERLNVCGGLCDGINGWRCLYKMAYAPGDIFIEVYRPPFHLPGGLDTYRRMFSADTDGETSDVSELPGIWYFRGDQLNGRGILRVDDRDRARLIIIVEGEAGDKALSDASGIARLVLTRLRGE